MARKQDKSRPYRIDYFDIDEMKDNDQALIKSIMTRAVTAEEAVSNVLDKPVFNPALVVIRAYRYYKKLGTRKKDVFKPVEELFSAKRALQVMEQVEAYRAANTKAPDPVPDHAAPDPAFGVNKATFYKSNSGTQLTGTTTFSTGHVTRFSDSSLYDEVCVNCGATDASGKLDEPCPQKPVPPTTGPDSPATVAVVADLNGMLSHDAHEQIVDKIVVDSTDAEDRRFPTPANTIEKPEDIAAAISAAVYDSGTPKDSGYCGCEAGSDGDCSEHGAVNDPMPGAPPSSSLAAKVLLGACVAASIIVILYAIFHH